MDHYDDPRWRRLAWVAVKRIVMPWRQFKGIRAQATSSGLESLRLVFLSIVYATWLLLIPLWAAARWKRPPARAALIVLAIGALSLLRVQFLNRKALRADSEKTLASSFRIAFFLQLAYSETPVLFSLGATLVVGSAWLYLIGLGLSMIGFVMMAPGRRQLAHRQAQLIELGSPLSLGRVLTIPQEPTGESN